MASNIASCAGSQKGAIESDLQGRALPDLIDLDLFHLIDRKILSELVAAVTARTLSAAECERFIHRRRQSHWYAQYTHPYEAIDCASHFLHTLDSVDLTVHSLAQGVEQYSRVWYQLDQRYRKFITHSRRSGLPTLLAPLLEKIENLYTNTYLLKVNDLWQPLVDAAPRWGAAALFSQASFYEEQVRKPFLTQGKKIFVVISDALRYEVGEELLRRIRQEDRYDADLLPRAHPAAQLYPTGHGGAAPPRDAAY